jgi:hypothetical protein
MRDNNDNNNNNDYDNDHDNCAGRVKREHNSSRRRIESQPGAGSSSSCDK